MKTFKEAKASYINDHLSKDLAQPQRRLNALAAIEKTIIQKEPSLLAAANLFKKYDKHSFRIQYAEWKNKPLSGAEKSVILGLFKFAYSDHTA
jgi:hypothetical protein